MDRLKLGMPIYGDGDVQGAAHRFNFLNFPSSYLNLFTRKVLIYCGCVRVSECLSVE